MAKPKHAKLKVSAPTAEIETFRDVRGWSLDQLIQREPDCFNGIVSIHRFRVKVEVIEEPDEVIAERLHKLWRECENFHHWQPLRDAAAKYGVELRQEDCGKDRKR